MNPYQNSPLINRRNSGHSPQKISTSINLTQRTKQRTKTQHSPRKTQQNIYTIHHQDKLKVYVKFKPPTMHKSQNQNSNSNNNINIHYINNKQVQIQRQSSSNNKIYNYDNVFHENVTSQQIFQQTCVDIIDQVIFEGKYGLIFVYGHTGTGKTYTMGLLDNVNKNSQGIVPQALRYIFKIKNKIQQKGNTIKQNIKDKQSVKDIQQFMKISISFNQIYMDQVYDMLDFEGGDKKLQIRQNQNNKQPYIQNNINIFINNVQQAYQLLNIGLQKRRVAQQKVNKRSSRGHGLITINVSMANGKNSRLCFVDLAGSERIKQSQSSGKTLTQAVHINTSLSALQTLLMNINQQSVRMYRGNKLTRFLQAFIQYGKIRLFVTSNYQNIQPLQFAKRCKGIKFMERQVIDRQKQREKEIRNSNISFSNSKANNKQISKQIQKYKKQIQKLQKQNKSLTQLFTNSLILLNKLYKSVSSTIQQQNVYSNFTLNNQLNMNIAINKQIQQKINEKINKLQNIQQQMLQKCVQNINNMKDIVKNKDQDGSSSLNTSVSLNVHNKNNINNNINNTNMHSTLAQQLNLQNCINLIKQPQKCNKVIQQIGFSIYQYIKTLGSLCQYKNIYKKQIFTFGIKSQLLQNKNKQFENSINYLLKSYNDMNFNGNIGLSKKIIRDLKQFGVQINDNNNKNVSRGKVTPRNSINPTNSSNPHTNSNNKLKIVNKYPQINNTQIKQNTHQIQNIGVSTASLNKQIYKDQCKYNNKNNHYENNRHSYINNKQQQCEDQLFKSYQNNLNSGNHYNGHLNNKINGNQKKIGKLENNQNANSTPIKNKSNNTAANNNDNIWRNKKKNNGGLILIQEL